MKSLVRKATLVGSLIFSLAIATAANATSLGTIAGTTTFSSDTVAGNYTQLFDFTPTVMNSGSVFAITDIVVSGSSVGITSVSLYEGSYSMGSQIASLTAIATAAPSVNTPISSFTVQTRAGNSPTLTAGSAYTLVVTGTAIGVSSYSGLIALAPVPEPETYAMLLAGLGMMGAVVQRRRKHR